ncbi:MAG: hypothetical protein RLY70_4655, partial [Planctomycetota bacterium]
GFANFGANPAVAFGSAVNELAVNGTVLRRVEIRPQSGIGYGLANLMATPAVAFGSAVNELAVKGTVLCRVEIRPQSEIGCGFANLMANPAVAYGSAVNEAVWVGSGVWLCGAKAVWWPGRRLRLGGKRGCLGWKRGSALWGEDGLVARPSPTARRETRWAGWRRGLAL